MPLWRAGLGQRISRSQSFHHLLLFSQIVLVWRLWPYEPSLAPKGCPLGLQCNHFGLTTLSVKLEDNWMAEERWSKC